MISFFSRLFGSSRSTPIAVTRSRRTREAEQQIAAQQQQISQLQLEIELLNGIHVSALSVINHFKELETTDVKYLKKLEDYSKKFKYLIDDCLTMHNRVSITYIESYLLPPSAIALFCKFDNDFNDTLKLIFMNYATSCFLQGAEYESRAEQLKAVIYYRLAYYKYADLLENIKFKLNSEESKNVTINIRDIYSKLERIDLDLISQTVGYSGASATASSHVGYYSHRTEVTSLVGNLINLDELSVNSVPSAKKFK